MAYATVKDLADGWRPLSDTEKALASELLDRAAVRIDSVCRTSGELSPEQVEARMIVSCDMVKRAMASSGDPGVTQMSQTDGPFSRQWTFQNPTGDLYLTKADRKLLGCGQRASSISLLGGE